MKNTFLLSFALLLVALASVRADISCKDYCKSLLSMETCFGTPPHEIDLCESEFLTGCMETCNKVTDKNAMSEVENVFFPGRGTNLVTCTCGSGNEISLCIRRCPFSLIQRGICATACVLNGEGRPSQFACAADTSGTCTVAFD